MPQLIVPVGEPQGTDCCLLFGGGRGQTEGTASRTSSLLAPGAASHSQHTDWWQGMHTAPRGLHEEQNRCPTPLPAPIFHVCMQADPTNALPWAGSLTGLLAGGNLSLSTTAQGQHLQENSSQGSFLPWWQKPRGSIPAARTQRALTFLSTLSRVSGRLMSKQMSTASESGYAKGRTLS